MSLIQIKDGVFINPIKISSCVIKKKDAGMFVHFTMSNKNDWTSKTIDSMQNL